MSPSNYSNQDFSGNSYKGREKSQKFAISSLVFLMIAVIFLGVWQIKNRVTSPFEIGDEETRIAAGQKLDENIDTDGDGLSDYDEIFLYGTSPYLEDTDSDGFTDYEELILGLGNGDPKCPVGGNCFVEISFEEPASSEIDLGDLDIDSGLGEISLPEDMNQGDIEQALSGQIDITNLRQLMIDAGADPDVLSQISDEELMASYEEVLNNNMNNN